MSRRPALDRHGYGPYSNGCRCEVCCAAKADYMRAKRSVHRRTKNFVERRPGAGRNFVDGITHGYAGYQDYLCRCDVCRAAKAAAYLRRTPGRSPLERTGGR